MSERDRARARRRAAYRTGRLAELAAAVFLVLKGYRPLAWRYDSPQGEIDLIVARGATTVFVEVKARAEEAAAAEAVSARQQARIAAAARHFIAEAGLDAGRFYRFDVVLVLPWRLPRHIVHAFEADHGGGGW